VVLQELADLIGKTSGANLAIALTFILWLSAFASALIDNIPLPPPCAPVIASLSATQGSTTNARLVAGTWYGHRRQRHSYRGFSQCRRNGHCPRKKATGLAGEDTAKSPFRP